MFQKINIRNLLGLLMLTFFVAAPNHAQTLEDWKAALSAAGDGKGCESIPYSNYRDECQRKSEKVNEFCKTDNWSCDGLETKALRVNIQNISEYINRLKEEKDRLNTQKSSASTDDEKKDLEKRIKEVEDKIYDKEKELDFMKKSLETDISDVDIRLYKGNQCLDHRKDAQSTFVSATSSAKSESDPEVKVIANQLIEYWEKRARDHQTALDDVKRGMEKCQKCKNGDL